MSSYLDILGKTVSASPTTGSPESGEAMRPTLTRYWDVADIASSYVTPPVGADGTTTSLTLIDYDGSPRTYTGLTLDTVTNRTELNAALAASPSNVIIRCADAAYGGDIKLENLTNVFLWANTHLGATANSGNPRGMGVFSCTGVGVFGFAMNNATTWGFQGGGSGSAALGSRGPSTDVWVQWCQANNADQEGIKFDAGARVGEGANTNANINIRYNEVANAGIGQPRFGEALYFGSGTHAAVNFTDGVSCQYNYVYKDDAAWPTGSRQAEGIDIKPNTSDMRCIDNLVVDLACSFPGGITFWEASGVRSAGTSYLKRNRVFGIYGETRLDGSNVPDGGGDDHGVGIFCNHGIPIEDNMIIDSERAHIMTRHNGGTVGNNQYSQPAERTLTMTRNIMLGTTTDDNFNTLGAGIGAITINYDSNVASDTSIPATDGNVRSASTVGLTGNLYDSGNGPGSQVETLGLAPASSYWDTP